MTGDSPVIDPTAAENVHAQARGQPRTPHARAGSRRGCGHERVMEPWWPALPDEPATRAPSRLRGHPRGDCVADRARGAS